MGAEYLSIGSLFSGIGGLELGLEAALGAKTVWQVESNPFSRKVLAKHWPDASRDVTDVTAAGPDNLAPVDIICGGFPCQDLSKAGKGLGLSGARSGLWWEFYRVIRELGPGIVVVENVPTLVDRGLSDVLGALAEIGFDAEWGLLSAKAVGAPHIRKRIFIIAWNSNALRPGLEGYGRQRELGGPCGKVAACRRDWWAVEPAMDRMAYGVPGRVDRLRALGNAVVPQVGFEVGLRVRRIMEGDGNGR